jgi:group I intron endonuclease
METGIYTITHTSTSKQYIGSTGKSFDSRWKTHVRLLKLGTHHSTYLQNAWKMYGESAFVFSVLECHGVDGLLDREQYYLDNLNPAFNMAQDVRSAMAGRQHTEQTRQKMSESAKRIKHGPQSAETVEKRASKLRGRTPSEETRAKIGASTKGRVFSEEAKCLMRLRHLTREPASAETRLKISKAMTGKVRTAEHCANIAKSKTKSRSVI